MLDLFAWIFFGLITGSIAALAGSGREPVGGLKMIAAMSLSGSILAGLIGRSLDLFRAGDPLGYLIAILGSTVLLTAYYAVPRRHLN